MTNPFVVIDARLSNIECLLLDVIHDRGKNIGSPHLSEIYYFKGPSLKFCPDIIKGSRAIIVGMERSGILHGEFIDEPKNSKNREFNCMISEMRKFFNT